MRKLFILLFIVLLFLPMVAKAGKFVEPFGDSLALASAGADTSRWLPVDFAYSKMFIYGIARGNTAADAFKYVIDVCYKDTTDTFQIYSGYDTKAVVAGDAFGFFHDTVAVPTGFEYFRLVRGVTVVTTLVTGRVWGRWE